MQAPIPRLVAHMYWADLRTLRSLHQTYLEEGLRLFTHVVASEQIYLDRIRGLDPWPQDFWPEYSMEECASLTEENYQNYRTYLRGVRDNELGKSVEYRNTKGKVFRTPVVDMIVHVALHGQHHRGQIAGMIRKAGGQPPVIDYIAFVRERPDDPKPDK